MSSWSEGGAVGAQGRSTRRRNKELSIMFRKPPPISDGAPKKALALFDFISTSPGELKLCTGDMVMVHEQNESGWWIGENDRGEWGFFPYRFVDVQSAAEARALEALSVGERRSQASQTFIAVVQECVSDAQSALTSLDEAVDYHNEEALLTATQQCSEALSVICEYLDACGYSSDKDVLKTAMLSVISNAKTILRSSSSDCGTAPEKLDESFAQLEEALDTSFENISTYMREHGLLREEEEEEEEESYYSELDEKIAAAKVRLESRTLVQLVAICDRRGLNCDHCKERDDLIEMILDSGPLRAAKRAQQGANTAPLESTHRAGGASSRAMDRRSGNITPPHTIHVSRLIRPHSRKMDRKGGQEPLVGGRGGGGGGPNISRRINAHPPRQTTSQIRMRTRGGGPEAALRRQESKKTHSVGTYAGFGGRSGAIDRPKSERSPIGGGGGGGGRLARTYDGASEATAHRGAQQVERASTSSIPIRRSAPPRKTQPTPVERALGDTCPPPKRNRPPPPDVPKRRTPSAPPRSDLKSGGYRRNSPSGVGARKAVSPPPSRPSMQHIGPSPPRTPVPRRSNGSNAPGGGGGGGPHTTTTSRKLLSRTKRASIFRPAPPARPGRPGMGNTGGGGGRGGHNARGGAVGSHKRPVGAPSNESAHRGVARRRIPIRAGRKPPPRSPRLTGGGGGGGGCGGRAGALIQQRNASDGSSANDRASLSVSMQRTATHRQRIAEEILSSEQAYVSSLQKMVMLYLIPCQEQLDSADPLISRSDIKEIFSNINAILSLNTDLLYQLSQRIKPKTGPPWDAASGCVADIFVKIGPYLKMYTEYCSNHPRALEAYHRLCSANGRFKELCETNRARPECNKIDLPGYLIMPVQRIPRYQLLLRELRSATWEYHDDMADLDAAVALIQGVNLHVDKTLDFSSDQMAKLAEVQAVLGGQVPNLVQPHRTFIAQCKVMGVYTLRGASKANKLMMFLFSDILVLGTLGTTFDILHSQKVTLLDVLRLEHCMVLRAGDTSSPQLNAHGGSSGRKAKKDFKGALAKTRSVTKISVSKTAHRSLSNALEIRCEGPKSKPHHAISGNTEYAHVASHNYRVAYKDKDELTKWEEMMMKAISQALDRENDKKGK